MAIQYITDDKGRKKAVILPIKEYQKMIDELEELEDIRLYDEAKEYKTDSIPVDKAFRQLDTKRRKS